MQTRRIIAIALLVTCLGLAHLPDRAEALEYRGRLSSVIETYQVGENSYAVPVYQYLGISAEKPLGAIGQYNYFYLYGRLAEDLADKDSTQSKLYSAFLDIRHLGNDLDARLGRQFIYTTAGSAVADALMIELFDANDSLTVKMYGGSEVHFDDANDRGDMIFGVTADANMGGGLAAGISYMQAYDSWNEARRMAGMDASYTIGTQARLYADGRYDLIAKSFDTSLAGVKYYIDKDTTVKFEYDYSYPVFDATDIYAVFASTRRESYTLDIDHRATKNVNFYLSASHETYEDDGDDSAFIETGTIVREYGNMSAEASIRFFLGRDEMAGGRLAATYNVSEKMAVGAGIESDNYEHHDSSDSETATLGYVEGEYKYSDAISTYVLVEYYTSMLYENDGIRAKLKVNYDF